MADYLTTDTELTSIANAIRTKGGTTASLTYPTGFVNAINSIATGKQTAQGTYSNTADLSSGFATLTTVADLGFTPTTIILFPNSVSFRPSATNHLFMATCIKFGNNYYHFNFKRSSYGASTLTIGGGSGSIQANSDGFVGVNSGSVQYQAGSSWILGVLDWRWMAIE